MKLKFIIVFFAINDKKLALRVQVLFMEGISVIGWHGFGFRQVRAERAHRTGHGEVALRKIMDVATVDRKRWKAVLIFFPHILVRSRRVMLGGPFLVGRMGSRRGSARGPRGCEVRPDPGHVLVKDRLVVIVVDHHLVPDRVWQTPRQSATAGWKSRSVAWSVTQVAVQGGLQFVVKVPFLLHELELPFKNLGKLLHVHRRGLLAAHTLCSRDEGVVRQRVSVHDVLERLVRSNTVLLLATSFSRRWCTVPK